MPEPTSPGDSHPRGTLAIVGLYGVLFLLGWFAMYLFIYLRRGGVTP